MGGGTTVNIVTCGCGESYDPLKAQRCVQSDVNEDFEALKRARGVYGAAFDPCSQLLLADYKPGEVGYRVSQVIRMIVDSAYVLDDATTAEMNEEEALEVEKVRPQVEVLVHSFMQAALFQRNARGRYAITHFPRRFAMALMELGVQAEVLDLLNRLRVTVGSRACQVSIDRIAWNHERDLGFKELDPKHGMVVQMDNHELTFWHITFEGSVGTTMVDYLKELVGIPAAFTDAQTAIQKEWSDKYTEDLAVVTCGCQKLNCVDGHCACNNNGLRCGAQCSCKCTEEQPNAIGSFIDSNTAILEGLDPVVKETYNTKLFYDNWGKQEKASP